ncbi:MAG: hypothetical protein QOK00_325 [Thermoleophilaceae bacterium]|jgi:hypothetical protein|nr:hypothetical protein [Thermoleophilaceae bacterium]
MCMQCMAGAVTAVGAASGTRAYVASRGFHWLTPKRLKAVTVALVVAALAASATLVSGSSAAPGQDGHAQHPSAQR